MLRKMDSSVLSKYIISIYNVNPLKLQKLLYYVQAWHLAILEEPLLDDKFEAWLHGPVIPSIYHEYKSKYGMYDTIILSEDEKKQAIYEYENSGLIPDQFELIEDVLTEYGDLTAYHLEQMTHHEDPWINARKGYNELDRGQTIISNESMKIYYSKRFDDFEE